MTINRPYNVSLAGKIIDAKEDNLLTWSVSGDVQTAYKVDIYLNSTYALVHTSNKVTSYNLSYTIPKNILTNGNEYKIFVLAYNAANESATSQSVIFQTSSKPIVTISPIGTVANFSNLFSATYTQSESVPLQSWIANLYDDKKVLLDHSDVMTDITLEYLFSNFETEKSYYVEFQATSEKGLTGTSGLIKFDVLYLRPKQNVNLSTRNIDNAGIEISWFVSQIIGKSNNIYNWVNGEHVDIRGGGKIWFDEGFSIESDFSLKVWLQGVENNAPLLTLRGINGSMVVKYNPMLDAFVLSKTTSVGTDAYESDSTVTYTFVSPYQLNASTGNKAVLLIQQIGNEIILETTLYD